MLHRNDSTQKIFKICLAIVTAVVAMQLIIQVWDLFLTGGEQPYTVERIAYHFSMVKGYWAWLVLAVVGGIVFPEKEEKLTSPPNTAKTLRSLRSRLPLGYETDEMRKFRFLKRGICIAMAAVCAITAVCIVALMLNASYEAAFAGDFFKSHTEAEKLVWVAVMSVAALGFCTAAVYVNDGNAKKELTLVKAAIAENAKQGIRVEKRAIELTTWEKFTQKFGTEKSVAISRIALAAVGVVLVVVGVFNGGMADVLEKAVQICTQCIGLG